MKNKEKVWKGVEEMSRAKTERRRQLARLPFEEKITILLQLQRIARGISLASGRKCHQVWK
ncbi:hypothetical protein M1O19_04395 [Dehalococcoidia bacterium]|nr:hypothetical protein [Dehalococcoidia bacterium]